MLLVAAGTMQGLLVCELLLRRILFLCLPSRRLALQRYADNAALSSFAALLLQTATVPLQAVASIVATMGRFWTLGVFGCICFAALLTLCGSSVHAYTVIARMYNIGVSPFVTAGQWLFVLLDFVFRAVTPLWNGFVFFGSQVLRHIVLPYSFHNIETLPELLQGLTLMLVSLGASVGTWLQNIMECGVMHESTLRVCGASISGGKQDCSAAFTPMYTQCYAAPNHLTIDLLTPGLFARQAALALRRVFATHCGVAALVLNFLLFPLVELHLYAALHTSVNSVLYGVIGIPLSTVRRCEAAKRRTGVYGQDLSRVQEIVACTPDWEPLASMMTSALESWGELINSWLNAAALLAQQSLGLQGEETARCEAAVRMSSIVLDAARAIEGLESVEALERLQGNGGLPDSETLLRVRVVGVTPRLFGVTDGKAVLYRGAHDGYVWAYGAWPFAVDVRLGLAAVSYSGSETETDSSGDARTGLLGCTCVDQPTFTLLCATAPYVQHVDSDADGLQDKASHKVSFPQLSLLGMTCARTAVRVLPLRWPRRRLANAGSGNYERFTYSNIGSRLQGDTDAMSTLQQLERHHRSTPAGAVEAAIFVQPLCGDGNIACALAAENCFPWCMGVVRGGARSQNVTMFNAARWESHVMLPDVDCGIARDAAARDQGQCSQSNAGTLVDMMSRAGIVRGECQADSMCTPSPVAAVVSSLVPISSLNSSNSSELGLVHAHKQQNWLGVRLEQQPFVVAGDVLLSIAIRDQKSVVVITRLYDIGHGSLQMASERLTLTSNAHAIEIAECSTQADVECLENAMRNGQVVLPRAFYEVHAGRPVEYSDGGEVPGVLPAAASRWAVHWASNPALEVYSAVFDFCRGKASFNFLVHSSFGPALVWTVRTMRSVDLEATGTPSAEQIDSRVSFMRVPQFFGDFLQDETSAAKYCSVVVGLKIVSVEYMNAENILVTVLAARPQDYDPLTGSVDGPRTYRHYFLHPSRQDCVDSNAHAASDQIFSCWRSQESGMWPDDNMLGAGNSQTAWDSHNTPCAEARLVPAFGSALMIHLIALVRVLQTAVESLTSMIAIIVSNPGNPAVAVRDLATVPLHKSSFHSMVDSGGARLFNVEEIISAVNWSARFNAHLLIYALNAFSSAVSGVHKITDKALAGMRTVVIGAAKIKEGGPTGIPEFKAVEAMFEQPIQFSAVHASTAVLHMSDGLKGMPRLPTFVTIFMRVQATMVGSLSMILRLTRTTVLRLLQAGAQAPAAVGASALLESTTIVENDFLNVMRFQCYGLAQIVGASEAWGHALQHACLMFPDTLEGVLTVITVLTLDYPTVSCACKLGDSDTLGESALSAVKRICLLRPLPLEEKQWITALALAQDDRKLICFATMDRANVRLATAFDKTYSRMYKMTQYAAGVADAMLGLVTGDVSACDAFDVSPYVMSIIPEPVDYFSSCTDTADCRIRCKEEYDVFEEAKQRIIASGIELGFETSVGVTLESMFFSNSDIEQGRNIPPFMIQDVVELPAKSCAIVCAGTKLNSKRCIVAGGLRTNSSTEMQLAIAYYCLPLDVSQYAFQWPGMESDSVEASGAYAQLPGTPVSVHVATTWGAQLSMRDNLIAVVHVPDTSTTKSTELMLEPITQILLYSPDRPVPILILRTSLRSERQLDVDVELPKKAGYLNKVEHVQVTIADNQESVFVLQIRGYRMKRSRIANSEQMIWNLPEKACVRCEVNVESLSGGSAIVDCEAPCVGHSSENFDDDKELDFVTQHMRICLKEHSESVERQDVCTENIMLPRYLAENDVSKLQENFANMELTTLVNGNLITKKIRVPSNVVAILRVDTLQRTYRDMQNQIQFKVALLSRVHYMQRQDLDHLRWLTESDLDESIAAVFLEILCANARDVHGGWLHVLQLNIDRQGARGALRSSLRAETFAEVLMQCNVHTCGACAHSLAGVDTDAELMQLENMCYAAKQCGVERCAGTLVNMRKPLCNLGKYLTSELQSTRVLLQALWIMITDKITSQVELTHKRREIFQIKWPEKAIHQTTCTAKDSIISMAATVTSIFGAVSHIMQDVSLANEHSSANVDARAHARYIMVLAATTNMLSAVFLWPVYQTIVLQKFVACTATDVSYTVLRVVDAGGSGLQPQIQIKFQDNMDKAAEKAGISVCLTEDIRQSLEDAGVRVQQISKSTNAFSNKITRTIADAISSTIDTVIAAKVQFTLHVIDIWGTWLAGVIKGIMDIVQTVDWESCKLPVVDKGMRSLGACPCNDQAFSIPGSVKEEKWEKSAFWCSGLLMLNEGDGNDRLVWNPFSLQELLNLPGARKDSMTNSVVNRLLSEQNKEIIATDYELFILCMREANSACEYFKPQDTRLSQQGVEVMQVISRCRENYKQARWDEAAVLYALFTEKEWNSASTLSYSASAFRDDSYAQMRKRITTITRQDKDKWSQKGFNVPNWECLRDALNAGLLRHDCQKGVSAFDYVKAESNTPGFVDACRVTSSASTQGFPRILWSGKSQNRVPISRLHPIQKTIEQRTNDAQAKITKMIDTEIRPLFSELLQADFADELRRRIDVNAFSTEGDQLHQFVDCFIMGPFAAAELNSNLHLQNVPALPVPLYHRGSATSRDFTSFGSTGGSPARQALIKQVLQHVDEHAQNLLVVQVQKHLRSLATKWLNPSNYLCKCFRGAPSISCCAYGSRQDIKFGLSFDDQTWDISNSVMQDTFDHVAQAGVLNTLWLQHIGEPVHLTDTQIMDTEAAHLFASSGTVPVTTYGKENSVKVLNNVSLWEWCTSRVTGLFATLPLTGKATNLNDGRQRDDSVPHVNREDYMYDPAFDVDNAPSRDHDHARMHSMELLVDKILRRSRELTPHFWTHAHRYVASDSVWCESENAAAQEPNIRTIQVPSNLHTHELQQESVAAPDLNDVMFAADVLRRCPCGWSVADKCFVPSSVCSYAANTITEDARLVNGTLTKSVWASLCAAPFNSHTDVLAVLQVLADLNGPILQNCSSRKLSTLWGLLAAEHKDAWYAGVTAENQRTGVWAFGTQQLATEGPGGLRLGMLSVNAPVSMQEHVQEFELGDGLHGTVNFKYQHTIAQPVCNQTLSNLLRQELNEYFVDTLIPMAHSTQIVPAVEYCMRWVIEYAILSILVHAEEHETVEHRQSRMRVLVAQQEAVVDEWKDKCSVQLLDISICSLRGVYDIVPTTALQAHAHCAFHGQIVTGCTRYYYTSSCLLYCDGTFYDPCLCTSLTSTCQADAFNPALCANGKIVDGRLVLAQDEGLLTSSLSWPMSVPVGETADAIQWELIVKELQTLEKFSKVEKIALPLVFNASKQLLMLRDDRETIPHTYCDDLMDYWPDVQHPVGYHPTTACRAADTNVRGFGAWMSRAQDGTAMIDSVRMRNASHASQVFGAGHLLCDAYAYAAPGHKLNPYYMQSKWKPESTADPAVPRNAPPVTLEEMPFLGTPSREATDTTYRMQGHPADSLLQHSVGIVRAWAHWSAADNAQRDANQQNLNSKWPHWPQDIAFGAASGFFLSSTDTAQPDGCSFPNLHFCDDDIDCITTSNIVLKCLKGAGSDRGICMQQNTCFEHSHCIDKGLLCSGEGYCTESLLRVRNEGDTDVDLQLFAKTGCDISMQKMSLFDGIQDFAQANGMCSFRNWFHFFNTTAEESAFQNIIKVRDKMVHRTDRVRPELLSDMHVLEALPHPCDRTYTHTDFNVCALEGAVVTDTDYKTAEPLTATKTWSEENKHWYARFCDMRPRSETSGFLNPYLSASGTLHSAAAEIRRCSEFDMCPQTHFHVSGRTVDTRRVRTYVANEDSLYGIQGFESSVMRDYCGLDAQRCLGMGYLLGTDCTEIDQEKSDICVVDQLVLPLIPILFPNNALTQQKKLIELRKHCVNAFGKPFKGLKDFELYADAEYYLTRPYSWTNDNLRNKVLQYSNSLLWFVFGMTEERETNENNNQRSDGRGFSSVEEYIRHSQCVVYLAKALLNNQQTLDLATNNRIYENSWSTTKSSDTPMPVMPGSSLYIFVQSVPVSISMRWFVQCVVLAANVQEGGASSRFLAELNMNSFDNNQIDCENYLVGKDNYQNNGAKNSDVLLTFKKWLQTAPFLFTILDSDSAGLHALQINRDVMDTISYAINELRVTEIPDLECVDTTDWAVLTKTTHSYENEDIWRYIPQDIESLRKKSGNFLQQIDGQNALSIHQHVLNFLTAGKYDWNVDNAEVTVEDLLLTGVIKKMHENLEAFVLPKEVYPSYEYVHLNAGNLSLLLEKRSFEEQDYVFSTANKCKCSDVEKSRLCRQLRHAEYSIPRTQCSDSKILSCTDETIRLLDKRITHKPPFLLANETLYLVLMILQTQIQNTVSGGFMALHRLREQADVNAISEIYACELPKKAMYVDLVEARQFNDFIKTRRAMNLKCPPKSIDVYQQTNLMHTALRQCRLALQERVGWKLPASTNGKVRVLELRPSAQSLLSGFYPSFMIRNNAVEHKNFVQGLTETPWELSENAEYTRTVCHELNGEISVMAPFWAEFFDVANNVAGEDSASDPPIACDMMRSGDNSNILIYSTLCVSGAASTASCAEHPEYQQHVQNTLAAQCALKHGQPVVRSRLGSLRRHLTPLCQQRPEIPSTCKLKHGSLHGHKGESVTDLHSKQTITSVQTGFWKKTNNIFRGFITQEHRDNAPALALDIHDIGGHCLEFSVTQQGWMYLRSAALTNQCKQIGGRVQTWLQNIEQDWAWENEFARKLLVSQESEDVSWRCPLHWLQRFHDDSSKHQARGPSWLRNKARFAHITGEYVYAHPTVRNTHKLRGLQAARWVSDTMACVAVDEKQCHAEEYLQQTLTTLLASSTDWHSVAYVPAQTDECARVLDWPSDCGLVTAGGEAGPCLMRH